MTASMFIRGRRRWLFRALVSTGVLLAVVAAGRLFHPTVRAQARTFAIHEIQGAASRSPLAGEVVTMRAIVTARKSNGFFLQTPDDAVDGDPRSSEGIFVFTATAPAANLTPGTFVAVTGRVIEFIPAGDPSSPPLTEIGEPLSIEVRGAGATLPVPIEN